ncbi:MAG: hypothetical protein K1X67_01645 [Fimbriimonadaceae bacterium]|nr:hypothetical protein [Fimbriimonadaceae bacterium]
MSGVASRFSDAKTKFQVGAAACAVVTAAALTPVAAGAYPTMPSPLAPISNLVSSDIALAPFIHQDIDESTLNPLDWGWIWIGTNREPPSGPAYEDVLVFTPLSLIPGFLKPLYKALTGWVDFQVCAFGVSLRIGPYLRSSVTVGHGC